MDRSPVLTIGVKTQAQVLISLGILWIDAERRAGLGNGVRSVVQAIEKVGQSPVVFRKIGHDPRGLRELVKSLIPFLLLPVDDPESEVQSGILLVRNYDFPNVGLGFSELLMTDFSCRSQQSCGYWSSNPGGFNFSGT